MISDTTPYPFTAHNIDLGNGEQTFAQQGWLTEESRPCISALRTLNAFYAPEMRPHIRIADLGCLEGGYAVAFARAGYRSIGVEARSINIAKCNYVKERLGLNNLTFIEDDVRNIEHYGPFDAVFCSGLLYHLDQPTSYLETLSRACRDLLILQTHYADDALPDEPGLAAKLSELVSHEGNLGRWYGEFNDDASEQEIDEAVWASWGNKDSFWIDKRHLLETLRRVGFGAIYEQLDYLADIVTDRYREMNGRSMFVAIKDGARR